MTGPLKKPTCTSVVLRWLVERDDFATAMQIRTGTGLSNGQVHATLHDLRRHRAIDAVEVDGTLFWYAQPTEDNRTRKHDEVRDGITRKRRKSWVIWCATVHAYVVNWGDDCRTVGFDSKQSKAHAFKQFDDAEQVRGRLAAILPNHTFTVIIKGSKP